MTRTLMAVAGLFFNVVKMAPLTSSETGPTMRKDSAT